MDSKEIIWGLVALTGYAIAIAQTLMNNRLKAKLVEAEFQKVVPVREDIEKIKEENVIRLHHLKDKKEEITKLEKQIKHIERKEISLEEALKILSE